CRTWRVPPVIRHALWLVVLIRLITPPVVSVALPFPETWRNATATGGTVETAPAETLHDSPAASSRPENTTLLPCAGCAAELERARDGFDALADYSPAVDREPTSVPEIAPPENAIFSPAIPEFPPAQVEQSATDSRPSPEAHFAISPPLLSAILVWGIIAGTL